MTFIFTSYLLGKGGYIFSSVGLFVCTNITQQVINVNVVANSPAIPVGLALYNLHPWYWNTHFYSLISSGKNSAFAYFAAAIASH